MTGGAAPDSAEAMDLAEEHRRAIETFYDCPYPMHRGLGEMYVADERFTKTYDDVAPGPGGLAAGRDQRQRRPGRGRDG